MVFDVSIWIGRSVTLWTACTVASRTAGSSMPGTPVFTSRTCAPASACDTASLSTYATSPSARAVLSFFFPVGLILSPIIIESLRGISTVREPDDMIVRSARGSLAVLRTDFWHLRRAERAAMCAGVVPQHPPTNAAPAFTSSRTSFAKSSGPTVKTVRPFSDFGRPAFGLTAIGIDVIRARRCTYGSMRSGPKPQLSPIASTRRLSRRVATHSTSAPVRRRPSFPSATVAITGREEFSFAASTAAFSSYVSPIVSMATRSAPAFTPMAICSANVS